jgi:hypothetical protein
MMLRLFPHKKMTYKGWCCHCWGWGWAGTRRGACVRDWCGRGPLQARLLLLLLWLPGLLLQLVRCPGLLLLTTVLPWLWNSPRPLLQLVRCPRLLLLRLRVLLWLLLQHLHLHHVLLLRLPSLLLRLSTDTLRLLAFLAPVRLPASSLLLLPCHLLLPYMPLLLLLLPSTGLLLLLLLVLQRLQVQEVLAQGQGLVRL